MPNIGCFRELLVVCHLIVKKWIFPKCLNYLQFNELLELVKL
jgi:hypothetical protein